MTNSEPSHYIYKAQSHTLVRVFNTRGRHHRGETGGAVGYLNEAARVGDYGAGHGVTSRLYSPPYSSASSARTHFPH